MINIPVGLPLAVIVNENSDLEFLTNSWHFDKLKQSKIYYQTSFETTVIVCTNNNV